MLYLLCNGLLLSKRQQLLFRFVLFSGVVHTIIFCLLILCAKRSSFLTIDLNTVPLAFDFAQQMPITDVPAACAVAVKSPAKKKEKKIAPVQKKVEQKKVAVKKTVPEKKKPVPVKKEAVKETVKKEEPPKVSPVQPVNKPVEALTESVEKLKEDSLVTCPSFPHEMTEVALELEIVKNEILASWKRPAYIPPSTTCTIEIEILITGEKKVEVVESSPSYALNTLALHFATQYQFPRQIWGKKVRIVF